MDNLTSVDSRILNDKLYNNVLNSTPPFSYNTFEYLRIKLRPKLFGQFSSELKEKLYDLQSDLHTY